MIWIASFGLLFLIVALIMAPVFDLRINKKVAALLTMAGLLKTIGLILSACLVYADPNDVQPLGIAAAVTTGIGLFFVLLACVCFAMSDRPAPASTR